MLGISINGKPVQAIVDTAAQITVISQAFANTFTPPLVTMKGAGNSDFIEANYCKNIQICIGNTQEDPITWTALIADISDPVIGGLDFLKAQNATIDLNEIQIVLGGKRMNATLLDEGGKQLQIARVKLSQQVRVEPFSSVQVLGHLDQHIAGTLVFKPCHNVKGLLSPHALVDNSDQSQSSCATCQQDQLNFRKM